MSAIEKQLVYRCASSDGQGWRVWEVRKVIGEPTPGTMTNYGFQDRDGEWWFVSCSHAWTEEFVTQYLVQEPGDAQFETLVIITKPKGAWTFKGWIGDEPSLTFVAADEHSALAHRQLLMDQGYRTTKPRYKADEVWNNSQA